jgi:uncharacterized protein YndB with AHSA1/START domain
MEQKTKVLAQANTQFITITREFDLPLDLLFRAYSEAEFIEQWMGTKVLKLESKKHGSYEFETRYEGKVVFKANGTIHDCIQNSEIIRTFEMDGSTFPTQIEFLTFEGLGEDKCKLTIHTVFKSVEDRDNVLKLPFEYGINMAHNKLQEIMKTLMG